MCKGNTRRTYNFTNDNGRLGSIVRAEGGERVGTRESSNG